MKTLSAVALLSVAMFSAQSQHVPSTAPSATHVPDASGRYQMTAAMLKNGENGEETIFLLDTATGRVWKYQLGFTTTKAGGVDPEFHPPRFISVPVDGLSQ